MNESGFLVFATLIAFLWIDGRDCCNGDDTPKPTPKPGTGGRNVISKKLMEPSSYTPDQDSKWLTPVYCPEGQFVKKMNVWQSDAAIDRKGLTNIELYCASTRVTKRVMDRR